MNPDEAPSWARRHIVIGINLMNNEDFMAGLKIAKRGEIEVHILATLFDIPDPLIPVFYRMVNDGADFGVRYLMPPVVQVTQLPDYVPSSYSPVIIDFKYYTKTEIADYIKQAAMVLYSSSGGPAIKQRKPHVERDVYARNLAVGLKNAGGSRKIIKEILGIQYWDKVDRWLNSDPLTKFNRENPYE